MKTLILATAAILLFGITVKAKSTLFINNLKDSIKRSLPSPIPNLPFPVSDWDGGPLIGSYGTAPNYPLQKALGISKSKLKIHGWVDVAGLSSSKNSNAPTSYDLIPNGVALDQVGLKFDLQPNTVQTGHFSYGFLSTTIFGTDYRYTTGLGYFSNQLLKHNNKYGFDPTEFYGLVYFPKVADGMLLKVGRFISPADIEAQWAPDIYLYTHSLMFSVDPYIFTGARATIKLGSYWQLELGVHGGNDMAPWGKSAQLNGLLMARWVSQGNDDSIYGGVNSFGNGNYTNNHDNLQMFVGTWGHKFNETLHMMTEAYYLYQYHALVGGTVIDGPP